MLCPVCNKDGSLIDNVASYSIYKCQFCGLEFSDPMKAMSANEYEESEIYFATKHLANTDQESLIFWGHKQFFKEIYKYKKKDSAIRLLDIGCGPGVFVGLALDKGFDACGVDFDRRSVQIANLSEKTKGKVLVVDSDEILKHFGPSSFELITFFEVLEHVEDPGLFLRQVYNLLATNGIIGVVVPQCDRFSLKYMQRESGDYPPHHLTRWSRKALKIVVEASGFEVLICRENSISLGLYRLYSLIMGKESPATNVSETQKVTTPLKNQSRAVSKFFEFGLILKQILLDPILFTVGLRGDRILLLAKKRPSANQEKHVHG